MRLLTGLCFSLLILFAIQPIHAADHYVVERGQPHAEIIIAEQPPRAVRLAAQELQTYVKKISGATLNIVTKPDDRELLRIFVGRSPGTDRLGITDDGLKDGAYRIVSGQDWLVLIGDDSDFTPVEPWPRNNNDIRSGKMQAAWNKITGKHWGYTHSQLHKHYSGANALFGTPDEQTFDKEGRVNVWTYDERGSFNAVCGFLRDLGVRWYMPGDVGEIVPHRESISLPREPFKGPAKAGVLYDKTVRPDFPMRILNFRAAVYGRDAMMWGFRLGVRQPFGRQAAHGLDRMTQNEQTLTDHPNWFALYGGKRHNRVGQRLNQLCYSNDQLFREAVEFARALQFDHYDMDVVSIMPPDGYTAICQCPLCEGKQSPQLGSRGSLSNYVWNFVNRVAKEVGKTHPDKLISNCAYGVYTAPPDNIEKLEPNVQVIIVGGRRPTRDSSGEREEMRQLRAAWTKKTNRPLEIFENYPFTGRGFYLPAWIPRVLGESINETKGTSRGEDIWVTMDFGENAIGFNHFLLYFTARMYWGGRSQDAVEMFDEYCRLFYKPVADEMRTFFRYCEEHWREMDKDGTKASRALELFAAAKTKVPPDSVFAERIGLIDNYLNGLRRKSVQLAQKRGPVPRLRLVGGEPLEAIVVDGRLDDQAWQNVSVASTGKLRELQTGRQPIFGTTFQTVWQKSSLYFAIRCDERAGPAATRSKHDKSPLELNVATTKDADQAIWYGDAVEILLNTDSHDYYQIVVNPAGAVINLDRSAERSRWFSWNSQAEVATNVADDHWTIEIRIPVTEDENDPLHRVIGRKPTQSLPWHVNVCRQRIRENASEYSAFSPTGTKGFHERLKFAHFYSGLSHQFEADPTVTDYLIGRQAADRLLRERKYEAAMAAYLTMAQSDGVTDFQKADALEQAAQCARSLKDFPRAAELAQQIPSVAVATTVTMQNLLEQREWQSLIERYGDLDLSQWPFWQIGAGAFARAKAYAFTKSGDKADADFETALAHTSDSRFRTSILTQMGVNRETHLQNDAAALDAYRRNYEFRQRIGAADEFRAVQNAAGILTRQKKFDEALSVLRLANAEQLRGYWRGAIFRSLGDTFTSANQKDKARAAYQEVLRETASSASDRKAAQAGLQSQR